MKTIYYNFSDNSFQVDLHGLCKFNEKNNERTSFFMLQNERKQTCLSVQSIILAELSFA